MNDDRMKDSSRSSGGSRLTCAQCERMVLDAMDGALGPDDEAQFHRHLAACPECSRIMEDAQRGSAWLEMLRETPPEPPAELMERILDRTSGDPIEALPVAGRSEPLLAYGPGIWAPRQSAGSWLQRLFSNAAQPRFAMTAAMAFFSIALTMNLSNVHFRDLQPANLRHGFWSMEARATRSYENLRVVHEVESRLREVRSDIADPQRDDDTVHAPAERPAASPQRRTKSAPRPGSGNSSLRPRNESGPAQEPATAWMVRPAAHISSTSAAETQSETGAQS